MIEVEGFHKAYREMVAVADLNFRVEPGEVLGLVGPNGAGKTTTLRVLAGIIAPTQGRLAIGGHVIAGDGSGDGVEAKRRLAYIPDEPRLFETLTVWEHLRFVASAYRVERFEPTAEALLAEMELTEKRHTIAQELSRGMRQKLAICCGYLHEPAAILFDEPLTGLDPRGIRTLRQSIQERAGRGAAVLVSSHLLALVEDLCSHLLILHKGKSLFFGPMVEARRAFAAMDVDASLEEVFFRATEGEGAASATEPAPGPEGQGE